MPKWNRTLSMRLNDELLLPVKDLINDIKAGRLNIDDIYNQDNNNEIIEKEKEIAGLEHEIKTLIHERNDIQECFEDSHTENEALKKNYVTKELYNGLANKHNNLIERYKNLLNGNNENVQAKELGVFDKIYAFLFES